MEDDPLCMEVEDIMCDQAIITTELNMDVDLQTTTSTIIISVTRFRLAASVIAQTVFPAVVGVYYAYLRNQKAVIESVCRQVLPTIFTFLAKSVSRSLSSVHCGITYPLAVIQNSSAANAEEEEEQEEEDAPEKCVECCVLYEPSENDAVTADVIFIHGIYGSLIKTWRQGLWQSDCKTNQDKTKFTFPRGSLKRSFSAHLSTPPSKVSRMDHVNFRVDIDEDEDEEEFHDSVYSKCWPKDWLSKDCPSTRIIAVNYSTDPHLWRPVWIKKTIRSGMVERSIEMIDNLLELNVGQRPIVWVGHSKGGLYVKQITIYASESNREDIKRIYHQTKAVMFYSVPHRGSYIADCTLPFLRRSIELLEIQSYGHFVLNLHEKFMEMLKEGPVQPEIFSFIETSFTLLAFIYIKIVTHHSADLGMGSKCGVPLDHREICKPSSRNCLLYRELVNLIETVICYDTSNKT